MVEVYHSKVVSRGLNQPEVSTGYSFPEIILDRIKRFKREPDKLTRITSYSLLRVALEPYGLDLHDIAWNEHGRPSIRHVTGGPDVDFNISHSGDLVVLAVSTTGKVGVDLELVREMDFEKLRRRFTDSQWALTLQDDSQPEGFFRLWTSIEAVLKANGAGIAGGINLVEFIAENEPGLPHRARYQGVEWYLQRPVLAHGYQCCIGHEGPFEIEMRPLAGNGA